MDLMLLVDNHNWLSRPLGINVWNKVTYHTDSRLGFLLAFVWLETTYASLLALIPTTGNEALLLTLGDNPFTWLGASQRYAFYPVVLCYRASSAWLITHFYLNDFNWLREANRLYTRLGSPPSVYSKLTATSKRCRLVVALVVGFRIFAILAADLAMSWHFAERNATVNMAHSHLFVLNYAVLYTVLNTAFMSDLYFLCSSCRQLFAEVNRRFSQNHRRKDGQRQFIDYFDQFSLVCLFTQSILAYIRPLYQIYFACNLIVTIFIIYTSLSAVFFFKVLLVAFVAVETAIILFFSHVIGAIDTEATRMWPEIYRIYVLRMNRKSAYDKSFREKLSRYFQVVWSGDISMTIQGAPINSTTSIQIWTLVMTVIAILMGNMK